MSGPAVVVVMGTLLLWPAVMNGPLPLVFPDSLDYLTNGRDLRLGVTRPPGYAYAILPLWRAFGLPSGLWAVVAGQAALSAWLVWLTFDLVLGRPGRGVAAGWCLGLAAPLLAGASSLPFLASWIMADALTAPTLLGVALLCAFWATLRQAERLGLVGLVLIGSAAHQTHAAVALAAAGTAAAVRLVMACPFSGRVQGKTGPWRGIAAGLLCPIVAVVAVIGLNRVVHGHADTAQASPAFLLARLVGDDLVVPHADALCGGAATTTAGLSADAPLCRRREWLGPGIGVDQLLWQGNSPLWVDYHGFEAMRDDARRLAWGTLRHEWRAALGNGLVRAARLAVRMRLPELDLRPMMEPLLSGLAHQLPEMVAPAARSAQLSGRLTQLPSARLAPWAMLAAGAVLVVLVPFLLLAPSLRRSSSVGLLGLMVLAGLAANALVVGLTAEAYDRYQARLGWLPLLVLLTATAAGASAMNSGEKR